MDTEALPPSAQTTLVILLGASEWPKSQDFHASLAFKNAANNFKSYLLDSRLFDLPQDNLLDLFNSEESYDTIDDHIGDFLDTRMQQLRQLGTPARDVLLYFIGHGGFAGRDDNFYLAIKRTGSNLQASAIPMTALADTLINKAHHLRRLIVLDCCFAAAAFKYFQGAVDQVMVQRTVAAFEMREKRQGSNPSKGTSLLCSSDHKNPSHLMDDENSTMFSQALYEVLTHGDNRRNELLSLRDLKELTDDWLHDLPSRNASKPVVHSPDQSEGDVADVPFFPNVARNKQEKQEIVVKLSNPVPHISSEPLDAVKDKRPASSNYQYSEPLDLEDEYPPGSAIRRKRIPNPPNSPQIQPSLPYVAQRRQPTKSSQDINKLFDDVASSRTEPQKQVQVPIQHPTVKPRRFDEIPDDDIVDKPLYAKPRKVNDFQTTKKSGSDTGIGETLGCIALAVIALAIIVGMPILSVVIFHAQFQWPLLFIITVIGLVTGFITSVVLRSGGYGVLGDMFAGWIGASIGGFIVAFNSNYWIDDTGAFIGACILIFILRLISGSYRRI